MDIVRRIVEATPGFGQDGEKVYGFKVVAFETNFTPGDPVSLSELQPGEVVGERIIPTFASLGPGEVEDWMERLADGARASA